MVTKSEEVAAFRDCRRDRFFASNTPLAAADDTTVNGHDSTSFISISASACMTMIELAYGHMCKYPYTLELAESASAPLSVLFLGSTSR